MPRAGTFHATAWLLAAAALIALIWLTMPRLDDRSLAPSNARRDNGFADGRFPVRGIERAPALKSGKRLVRVRCAGAAAKVSFCWVART